MFTEKYAKLIQKRSDSNKLTTIKRSGIIYTILPLWPRTDKLILL